MRRASSRLGGGRRGARDRAPVGRLDQCVAALQGALRVVRGERERERRRAAARAGAAELPVALQRGRRGGGSARSPSATARRARGPQLAQLLVQPRAVARDVVGGRAREPRRACARGRRSRGRSGAPAGRPGARSARARGGAVDRHGRLGGVRRRRARDGGDVVDQRVVGVVADRGDDRHAQHRHGPAQRLVAEREQVGERAAAARDDDHLDRLAGREVLQRARDRRGGVAVLHRRERPHDPPGPAAAAQPGQHVVARLAALAGDDADRARQRRARQPLLRLDQALGVQRAAQPLDLGQQVALAGQPQVGRPRRRTAARRCASPGSSRSRRRRRPARRRRGRRARARPSPRATSSTAARRRRRAARTTPARGRP